MNLLFRSLSSASTIFDCSSHGVEGSLGFPGVLLLFVVLHAFLPFVVFYYSSRCMLELSEILLINLLGDHESKAQMFVLWYYQYHSSSYALVPCVPGDSSTFLGFALLPWSLLSQVYFGLGYQL